MKFGVMALSAAAVFAAGELHADEVQIDAILSASGAYSFVGVPLLNGIRMANEEFVKSGAYGNRNVTLNFHDNASNRQEAVALFSRLSANPDADMILGPISSAEALATGPIANEQEIPMFTVAGTPLVLTTGPWVFKSSENAETIAKPLADFVALKRKPEECVLISIKDNEGYVHWKNVFKGYIEGHGVKIASDDGILGADTDFTALATKIIDLDPDCLFFATPAEPAANFLLQARSLGLDPATLVAGESSLGSQQFITMGGPASDGVLFTASFVADGFDRTRAFTTEYTAKYGVAPDLWAATGYSMMAVIANALRDIDGDVTRANLRDAMARTRDVPVLLGSGTISFDENRVPYTEAVVMKVENGTWVRPD
jgi:branched-chain amino acid transport system substrate-binding protein